MSSVALRKRMLGWDRRNVGNLSVETHGSPEAKIAFVEKALDQDYEIACYRQLRANFGFSSSYRAGVWEKVLPPLCCARRKSHPSGDRFRVVSTPCRQSSRCVTWHQEPKVQHRVKCSAGKSGIDEGRRPKAMTASQKKPPQPL